MNEIIISDGVVLTLPDEELEKRLFEGLCENYLLQELKEIKEERKNAIKHYQPNLHPLPKHQLHRKSNWIRTRSNPKLR